MNRLNGAMLDDLRAEVGALYSAADHIGHLLRVLGAPDRVVDSASTVRVMADRAGAYWLERAEGRTADTDGDTEMLRGMFERMTDDLTAVEAGGMTVPVNVAMESLIPITDDTDWARGVHDLAGAVFGRRPVQAAEEDLGAFHAGAVAGVFSVAACLEGCLDGILRQMGLGEEDIGRVVRRFIKGLDDTEAELAEVWRGLQ